MNDDLDLFDDDGSDLDLPTMRGSANLDAQDYARSEAGGASIFEDDLQEDTPSTPGRNPGAAAATDIDGTDSYDLLDVNDGPGMDQTTYGAAPWPPGAGDGYRPRSMQTTDMELRALDGQDELTKPRPAHRDDMHNEPEVINAVAIRKVHAPKWHGNRNQMPSNADVDLMTIYDRSSYERSDSSQDTIGNGIFGMEEGVTWRARDGIFGHQFAMPAYIGEEDELDVQQSQMWDTTADEWRVVQPSAGGVPLKRRVAKLKPMSDSPFVIRQGDALPSLRPDPTGPRSRIESFGRRAARCIVGEAKRHRGSNRDAFLQQSIAVLGPKMSERCKRVADKLIAIGYPPELALEDAIAHCVMHATVADLTAKRGNSSVLPRLDRLAKRLTTKKGEVQAAAANDIGPLTKSREALRTDLGRLYGSNSARGLGAVGTDEAVPAPNGAANGASIVSTRNVLIASAVGIGGYLIWANRKSITRNAKKLKKRITG